MRKIVSYIFIILGISFLFMYYYPSYSIENQEEIININDISSDELDTIYSWDEVSFDLYSCIGTIFIPSISVEVDIIEGSDVTALELGVGHVVGSGYTSGNTVLAAHRASYFKRLDEVVIGDSVVIRDSNGTDYEYKVYEIFEVYPEDVWILEDIGEDIVTLITCTDYNRKRLIVRAK